MEDAADRYTCDPEGAAEALIARHLDLIRDRVLARVPCERVDCLVLGGGYGRGEGGVARTADGARPHNDYDVVLIHNDGRAVERSARNLGEELSAACGIEVDVEPIRRARVPRLPPALTWFELGQGHRVLWGDGRWLEPLRRRRLEDVHATEWGRLLVNRGCGLVFARWVLAGEPCAVRGDEEPAPFATRQIQKAWLALGDVWLAERGRYHPSVRERAARWDALAAHGDLPAWSDRYRDAVRYKLAPTTIAGEGALRRHCAELAEHYRRRLPRHPSAGRRPLVGGYATLRHLPPRSWAASRPWRYPRERIRLALIAELDGRARERDRLVGSRERMVALWRRFG